MWYCKEKNKFRQLICHFVKNKTVNIVKITQKMKANNKNIDKLLTILIKYVNLNSQ